MGLPCIDDSCNILATINPTTKHLILNAKVNPVGGLLDGDDDDCLGLGIHIIGEPATEAAVDQGLVKLRITNGGEVWVAPARSVTEDFGGGVDDAGPNPVAARIKHDGTESLTVNPATNPISDNELTNPYDSAALVIITGTFRLGWTVDTVVDAGACIPNKNYIDNPADPGAILYVPYHAKIRAQIIAAIGTVEPVDWPAAIAGSGAAPQRTAFFDIGGDARNDKTPQDLRDWRDFSFGLYVPAGEKVWLAASARHDGDPTIRTFVETERFPAVGHAFDDRGIKASGEAIWLPVNGSNI